MKKNKEQLKIFFKSYSQEDLATYCLEVMSFPDHIANEHTNRSKNIAEYVLKNVFGITRIKQLNCLKWYILRYHKETAVLDFTHHFTDTSK